MTLSLLLGVLVAVLAATCWHGIERGPVALVGPAKVGTLAALVLLALVLGALNAPGGPALLAGLVLSLLGDIALLRRGRRAFEAGLGAFLLSHVAYVVAFSTRFFSLAGLVVALLAAAPFGLLSARRVHRGAIATEGRVLGRAVAAYSGVLLLMVAAAGATGDPVLIVGALLFLLSDAVLGLDRFVAPRRHADLVVMVLYHLAQAAIVLALLR